MKKLIGNNTYKFNNPPVLLSTATVGGPLEGEGPLGKYLDHVYTDSMAGTKSFEKAEKEMLLNACYICLNKVNVNQQDLGFFISGDLLNQIITSTYAALELKRPFIGIYGACSSSVLALALAAILIDGGFARLVMAATSSHNSTAERQFRYPVEYGFFRKPSTQYTATGAGAALVASSGEGPRLTHITIGRVVDLGIKDPYNLGAAMAPGFADTLRNHFVDTGFSPRDYDLILSGDLGQNGLDLAKELMKRRGGYDLADNYNDCGLMIYDRNEQDVHAGASGCASSALVAFGYIYKKLLKKEYGKILLLATGSLHSPVSVQQGENIPAIAHAITIEA